MTKWEQKIRFYAEQDFEAIRLQCRQQGTLFEDPLFPARLESLAVNYRQVITHWNDIVWKRPNEIVGNPQLIVNGIKRTDPNQGDLGTNDTSNEKTLCHRVTLLIRLV
jgi:hypothetical protein